MPILVVGSLKFVFPQMWEACQYDNWTFYKKQFSGMWEGIKGMDLLAIDQDRSVWLIEVKDYRQHPRSKPSDLAKEVAEKAFDTLAALIPAQLRAQEDDEQRIARKATNCKALRVVLHLEQPSKHSALFPRVIKPLDVQQQLRCLLKAIDPHAKVCETGAMRNVPWIVE